jgi:hypothetical protein
MLCSEESAGLRMRVRYVLLENNQILLPTRTLGTIRRKRKMPRQRKKMNTGKMRNSFMRMILVRCLLTKKAQLFTFLISSITLYPKLKESLPISFQLTPSLTNLTVE